MLVNVEKDGVEGRLIFLLIRGLFKIIVYFVNRF